MLSNDTGVHAPPTTGLYAYNTFKIGSAGFPAVGETYTDPVFGAVNPEGSVIRRLTDVGDMTGFTQDIYEHHYINADNTNFFWRDSGGTRVVRKISDGSVVRSPVSWSSSGAGDVSWHPTDPNSYFYLSGSDIRKYNVSAGTSAAVNSAGKFPSAMEDCGGFLDLVDNTATKFTVQYGGGGHVYDSTTDTLYTGAVSPAATDVGFWGIFPNAAHAMHTIGGHHTAYPLDHVNHVVGTGFPIWNFLSGNGSHCGIVSASNGKNYVVRVDNQITGAIYIVEVKDRTGMSDADIRADSIQLFAPGGGFVFDMHYSGVGIGAFQDWCFLDTEALNTTTTPPADLFDGSVTGWLTYEQEIIAVNVITLEVRRLAHHRSRSVNNNYDYQPKVSCSWDGGCIMFLSNYNYQGTDASDGFAIQNPLGVGAAPATPPTGTFFFDDSGYPLPGPQGSPTTVSVF